MDPLVVLAIVGLVVVIVTAWATREIVLWYFRVNEVVELLESIDSSLKQMPAAQAWRARMRAQGRKTA